MAKVNLELSTSAKTEFSEDKVKLLESHNIPFEVNGDTIFLIAERSTVCVGSKEYDEPYNKFCMELSDSTEGSIYMGESKLKKERLSALYEVFGDSLFFEMALYCGGDSVYKDVDIILNEKTGEVEYQTDVMDDDEDEDDDDW